MQLVHLPLDTVKENVLLFAEMASIYLCVWECERVWVCAEDFYLSLCFIEISHPNNCYTYLDNRIIVVQNRRMKQTKRKKSEIIAHHTMVLHGSTCIIQINEERKKKNQQQQEALILNNFPMIFIVVWYTLYFWE